MSSNDKKYRSSLLDDWQPSFLSEWRAERLDHLSDFLGVFPDLETFTSNPKTGNECGRCGGRQFVLVAVVKSNGQVGAAPLCTQCGDGGSPGYMLPHKIHNGEGLPVFIDFRNRRCEVCGALGVELHHWAPSHIFGSESDRWPTSYLCRPHHSEWHGRVTPTMSSSRIQQAKVAADNLHWATRLRENRKQFGAFVYEPFPLGERLGAA